MVEKKNAIMLFQAMETLYNDREKVDCFGKNAKIYATENFEQKKLFSHILTDRQRLL